MRTSNKGNRREKANARLIDKPRLILICEEVSQVTSGNKEDCWEKAIHPTQSILVKVDSFCAKGYTLEFLWSEGESL
jgi:hypothetical protein